jgi:hypothetical protein
MTLACAFAQEAEAAALKQGECKPFADMITALKVEGQKDLIQADKITERANSTPLYIITSNDNGDGYELGGDRRTGEDLPKELCVGAVLTNIRLNNAFSETVPDSFYVPGNLTDAQVREISERKQIGGSIDHNTLLSGRAEHGVRPALQARVVLDGGKEGPRLTILMDTRENRLGSANASSEDGFAVRTGVLSNVGYSQTALKILEQGGPQVAALAPN